MLNVALFSQRDPKWANILLGDNTTLPYTIGNYGCLITCLSGYINKNPQETNQLLKNNQAFQDGGLFIWSKSTVLGLTQTYVSPKYTGPVTSQGLQKIKDYLDQHYPLLCEVDFNPNTIGEEMHFVLIIGYEEDSFYAMDPWVGEVINLSVYGGAKRAIIQFRSYDKQLPLIINPPIPIPSDPTAQPIKQIIIDAYRAICGEKPSTDEIKARLDSGINTYDLIKDLLNNDGRSPLIKLKEQIKNVTAINNQQVEMIEDLRKQLQQCQQYPPIDPIFKTALGRWLYVLAKQVG